MICWNGEPHFCVDLFTRRQSAGAAAEETRPGVGRYEVRIKNFQCLSGLSVLIRKS